MSTATLEPPRSTRANVVALDPADPALEPIRDLVATLPKVAGGPVSIKTVHGWARAGVLTRSGQRLRLPTIRMGSRLYSTRAAVLAWIKALSEARESAQTPAQ